jgi:hypothetical protein
VWEAATAAQAAAWSNREGSASQALNFRRIESAPGAGGPGQKTLEAGALSQWLVLSPMPVGHSYEAAALFLDQEQIAEEGQVRPRAGQRVRVGDSLRVWQPAQSESYILDFNALLGEVTEWCAAYALCYIQTDTDRSGLLVKVGSDDLAKIYLNGTVIYKHAEGRSYVADDDLLPDVELKAGINTLLLKVINGPLDWKASVRFTDAAGRPLQGIRVSIDPEVREER